MCLSHVLLIMRGSIETNVLPLFSELDRDVFRWSTVSHFIPWLSL